MSGSFSQWAVPILGVITSNFIAFSPYPELSKSNMTRSLGELNVFPLAMMVPNTAAWLFYAVAKANIWVWWSNFPGFIASLWYASVLLRCLDLRYTQLLVIQTVVGVGLTLNFIGLMCFIELENSNGFEILQSITGVSAITCLSIFYAAPLSVIASVIKSKDSSAIVFALAIASGLNGLIWATFGIIHGDAFLYGPNLVGFLNGSFQAVLCIIYPPKVYVKTMNDPSSTSLMYQSQSFGSVATELNFATDSRFFDAEVAADSSTPPDSPGIADTFHRKRQPSEVSDLL